MRELFRSVSVSALLIAGTGAGFAQSASNPPVVGVPGGGTVTSVGLSLPASVVTVTGSPVTSTGTLTGTLATQTANQVLSGPASGGPAAPTFRALTNTDLPTPASQNANRVLSGPASGGPATPTYRALVLGDLPDPYNTQLDFLVDDYGAVHNFVGDDAAAINAAIAAAVAAGGGRVLLGPYAYWAQSASITVPANVVLTGYGPYTRILSGADNTAVPFSIYFPSANSLNVQGGQVIGLALFNDLVHFTVPGTTRATIRAYVDSYAGTGVRIGTGGTPTISNGSYVRNCYVGGFATGILVDRASNVQLIDIMGDCTNGLKIDQSYDDNYLENIEWIGQLTAGRTGSTDNFAVLSMADNGAGLIRLELAANDVVNLENDLMVTAGTGGQGARGLWPGILKIDATHVDLPGSAFAPVVAGCGTTSGTQYVSVPTTANLQPGMTVTGAGIPPGATIGAVSYGLNAILLTYGFAATATGTATLTFGSTAYTPSSSALRYEGGMRSGVGFELARADGARGDGLFCYGYLTGFKTGGGVGVAFYGMQADDFGYLCPNQHALPIDIDNSSGAGLGYGNVFAGSLLAARGIAIRHNITVSNAGAANVYQGFRIARPGASCEVIDGPAIFSGLSSPSATSFIFADAVEQPVVSGCCLPFTSFYSDAANPKWTTGTVSANNNYAVNAPLAAQTVQAASQAVFTSTCTTSALDEKTFQFVNVAGALAVRTTDDALTTAATLMVFRRVGNVPKSVDALVPMVWPGYTVATLPSPPALNMRAFVTDALTPTFLAVVTGGGVVRCPVFYNGANWICG